jgi:phosphatidate cytidylyltransferase
VLEPELALVALAVAAWIAAMIWRDAPGGMLASAGSTIAPVGSVALMLAYLVALRELPGNDGSDLLLLLILCIIFGDAGAYYIGRWLGRHPLAPILSPRKTWEGLCGGLVASVVGALLAHLWFYQRLPLVHAMVLGLVLGLSGVVGDLAESAFKRAVGVKDSSTLLPGHGGLLDRSDSFLFSGPLLYYYYQLLLKP